MSTTRKMVLAGLALFATALGFAVWVGVHHQQSQRSALVDRLTRAARADGATAIDSSKLNKLPVPVVRYLKRALRSNQRLQLVRLAQVGMLRTDVRSERWMSFEANHVIAPQSTAFVWDARVHIAPLLHVRVRDSLIDGRGSGQVSLMSALTVAEDSGTPEMNSGSLHRYLAEAVWYPTALLPSAKLQWNPIDPNKALAVLTDRGVSVSLEFRFNDTGEVTGIYTPARWGSFAGGYKQLPWEGHFSSYQEQMGLFVPTRGEVGWYVDKEWKAVWKGRITAFDAQRAN